MEVIMKKFQFNQVLVVAFRPLTNKIMVLVYQSIILVLFTMLASKQIDRNIDFATNMYLQQNVLKLLDISLVAKPSISFINPFIGSKNSALRQKCIIQTSFCLHPLLVQHETHNHAHSHLPHNFWKSYEHLIHYKNEDFCAHSG